MKVASTTALFILLSSAVTSLSVPRDDLSIRDIISPSTPADAVHELEKRRGGGGRGGGGGGGRSGGGGGGRGGSGGSSSSSRTSTSSNSGGSTRSGSGRQPAYGGGAYYAGGAASPYASGGRSPRGLSPFMLLPLGALAFFPGIWLYGAYAYPYGSAYHWRNETSNKNESLPVVCLCQQYSECGCDDNNNSTFYEDLFNGTQPKNSSVVRIADVNGTETIYINGTLPNGTTVADPSIPSSAMAVEATGYWMMVAAVIGTVWGL